MNRSIFQYAVAVFLLLTGVPRLFAQAHPLEEMPISLNGAMNLGYIGGKSDGSLANSYYFGGTATLDGYYHDPRFIKFEVTPNYRFDRNGELELLTHESNQGVTSRVELFNASSMPISFTHSFMRVASTNFTGGETPISLAANGTTNDFDISWGFHRGSLPALSLSYGWGRTDSMVEGWQGTGVSSGHNGLNATATYNLLKFRLFGNFTMFENRQHRPDFLGFGYAGDGTAKQKSENFGVTRPLPFKSNFDAHFGRSDTTTNYFGTPMEQQYDTAGATLNSTPTKRLLLNFNTNYTSNIAAQIISEVISPSSGTPIGVSNLPGALSVRYGGSSITHNAGASFDASHGFWITGAASRQMAKLAGQTSTATAFTGSLMYSRFLGGGVLNAMYSGGVNELGLRFDPTTQLSTSSLMHSAMAAYARQLGRWRTQGTFRYSHTGADSEVWPVPLVSRAINVDLTAATRLWHKWNLGGGFNFNQNRATLLNRNSSFNKGFNVNLSNRTWTFLVQDQFNSGYSFVSAAGIIPIDLPGTLPVLVPQTFYTDSTGLTASVTFTRRRLQIITSYTDTSFHLSGVRTVSAGNTYFDSRVYYKFRKVDVRAGFRRWTQEAMENFGLNRATNAWYFEITRQFRMF